MLLCQVVTFFFCEVPGISDTLTHSWGGLLGETCPVVKDRRAQLTSPRLDACSLRTLALYHHATVSGLLGNLNQTRMQWHLARNCNVNH